ncbi:MAG: LamG-like jellyroll fold domain-containing protein, partial [Planctomycetota bacterium]
DGVGSTGAVSEGFIWNFKVTYDPTQIVDPNLRAWYKLDGDGTDSSGYGRDLTMNGEPGYVDAMQGQGMAADGVDDYGVYDFFPAEEWAAYTITAWAKLDALGAATNESVFSSYNPSTDGFQIDVNGISGTYRLNCENEQATIGPESDGWVHLAVAYDGLRASLFYNGKYVDTLYTTEGTFNQFGVGTNRVRGTLFGGIIDEVRI